MVAEPAFQPSLLSCTQGYGSKPKIPFRVGNIQTQLFSIMATYKGVHLVLQTSAKDHSGSKANLQLKFVTSGEDLRLKSQNANSGNNCAKGFSEKGRAVTLTWNEASGDFDLGRITSANLEKVEFSIIGNSSGDAYLPQAYYLILRDTDDNLTLLSGNNNWPKEDVMSTDQGEGQKTYVIYQQ